MPANNRILKKTSISLSHFPSLLLIIGYPVYWLEIFFFNPGGGRTTLLATFLVVAVMAFFIFVNRKEYIREIWEARHEFIYSLFSEKFLFGPGSLLIFVILLTALYASLLPPHLPQEYDILNYHMTLPRQHLILGSFHPIPWATADYYFMPVDFALSPFWFVTSLPNKFPQFLFILGLAAVSVNLMRYLNGSNYQKMGMMVVAIFGMHVFGIQMGTGMLDLLNCYLFVASVDSLIKRRFFLGLTEFSFYFWSKSFMPLKMMIFIFLTWGVVFILSKVGGGRVFWFYNKPIDQEILVEIKKTWGKMLTVFVILSVLIGGPFAAKSLYYTGTPFFPIGVGTFSFNQGVDRESGAWQSLVKNAKICVKTKDQYGSGRSPLEFLKHLWLIAVPEKGVNNRYDYPVGLMYLLFVGPFLWGMGVSLKRKQIPVLSLGVVVYWLLWWMSTQQTRFLFVPLIFMIFVAISQLQVNSKVLKAVMLLSLFLTALSVVRAHKTDWGKSRFEVLRGEDKELVFKAKTYNGKDPVTIHFPDAAFAAYPVNVERSGSVFVITQ